MIMATVGMFGEKLGLLFEYNICFMRNIDTNNSGPCWTMVIKTTNFQMCLQNKSNKKESYNCTDKINMFKKTSHLCIKKCKCES